MSDCRSSSPSSPSPGSRTPLPGHLRSAACPTSIGPGRLASLKTRDMTLGGAYKKTRRTFEPNVHVLRKSKDELKEQISSTPKQPRLEREERRKVRRAEVKRERPQTIQVHSIFEQGPAESTPRTGRGPCPSPWSLQKSDPEEDIQTVLKKLTRDDFIEDPALRNSSKLKPIELPLCHPPTLSTSAPVQAGSVNTEQCEEKPSLVELLCDLRVSDREELFFMQLPDCLPAKAAGHTPPGTAPTAPRAPPRTAMRDITAQDKTSTSLQTQDSVLSQFSEGCLGKLQIRRSGRVVLKLGDISLDVNEGTAFSFLQQLVSVRLSEGRSGDMMVLGNVHHKLVLSPDFHTLLDQTGTKSH